MVSSYLPSLKKICPKNEVHIKDYYNTIHMNEYIQDSWNNT